MAWTELEVIKKMKSAATPAPVSVSANGGGRFAPWLEVKFRNDDVPMAWLVAGAKVKCEIGSGEHVGMLRVSAGGQIALRKSGDRATFFRVGALPSQEPKKFKKTAVKFQIDGGGL